MSSRRGKFASDRDDKSGTDKPGTDKSGRKSCLKVAPLFMRGEKRRGWLPAGGQPVQWFEERRLKHRQTGEQMEQIDERARHAPSLGASMEI